jgi:hypothetical protein
LGETGEVGSGAGAGAGGETQQQRQPATPRALLQQPGSPVRFKRVASGEIQSPKGTLYCPSSEAHEEVRRAKQTGERKERAATAAIKKKAKAAVLVAQKDSEDIADCAVAAVEEAERRQEAAVIKMGAAQASFEKRSTDTGDKFDLRRMNAALESEAGRADKAEESAKFWESEAHHKNELRKKALREKREAQGEAKKEKGARVRIEASDRAMGKQPLAKLPERLSWVKDKIEAERADVLQLLQDEPEVQVAVRRMTGEDRELYQGMLTGAGPAVSLLDVLGTKGQKLSRALQEWCICLLSRGLSTAEARGAIFDSVQAQYPQRAAELKIRVPTRQQLSMIRSVLPEIGNYISLRAISRGDEYHEGHDASSKNKRSIMAATERVVQYKPDGTVVSQDIPLGARLPKSGKVISMLQQQRAMQCTQEKAQAAAAKAKATTTSRGQAKGEEATGELWSMTSWWGIPEDERGRLLDDLLSRKTQRAIAGEAREREAEQAKEGLQTKRDARGEAMAKRKREAEEWDTAEGAELQPAKSVAALQRLVDAAGAVWGAKVAVLRDQIRVREKQYGVSISELRSCGCFIAGHGQGGVQVEYARLMRVVSARIESEASGSGLGPKRARPLPLSLRDAPAYPDAEAKALDDAHRAAVKLASQLLEQHTVHDQFTAPSARQPEQARKQTAAKKRKKAKRRRLRRKRRRRRRTQPSSTLIWMGRALKTWTRTRMAVVK